MRFREFLQENDDETPPLTFQLAKLSQRSLEEILADKGLNNEVIMVGDETLFMILDGLFSKPHGELATNKSIDWIRGEDDNDDDGYGHPRRTETPFFLLRDAYFAKEDGCLYFEYEGSVQRNETEFETLFRFDPKNGTLERIYDTPNVETVLDLFKIIRQYRKF